MFGDLFAIDAPAGWWFPNWGRNFVLPTEAVYHVLVLVAWLGILRRRWIPAFTGVGALAATHPFSGAQHLIILCAWLGYQLWRERTRAAFLRAALGGAMFAAFAGYYFGYLDSFPEHRHLQEVWGQVWRASFPFLLLSTGPVIVFALIRLRSDRWRSSEGDRFLWLAGCVTLLLMKHDWFMTARQPLHFARGYNWLPFWLVALPKLQEWTERLMSARRPLALGVGALIGGLVVFDNAAFVIREWRDGEGTNQHLDSEQREMFSWMDGKDLRGVLLCADPRLSYLSATYTSVQPYLGHLANTPYAVRRWREISGWQRRGETGPWFGTVDYILVERRHPPLDSSWRKHWRQIHANAGYILLAKEN